MPKLENPKSFFNDLIHGNPILSTDGNVLIPGNNSIPYVKKPIPSHNNLSNTPNNNLLSNDIDITTIGIIGAAVIAGLFIISKL